jgi:hypothetical protein
MSAALCTVTALLVGLAASPARANDAVREWNQHAAALTVAPTSGLSSIEQTRVMAIVQVAVHDAVNAITGEYATYLRRRGVPEHASPEAAAIAAAHYALRHLFASQAAALDAQYSASLVAHGLTEFDAGIAVGRWVAATILALRADDGSSEAQFDYIPPGAGAPGVWTPPTTAPALLPGWGNVTPFVLRKGSQFRPGPPPALTSGRYARDYNEVQEVGARTGSTRSEEQTAMAQFWRASPVLIWNAVLQQALDARPLGLSASARTLALFYLAAADASIATWEAKYVYNFWRPEPAIVNGDVDDNPATFVDPTWQPLFTTPPHPEYPAANPANSGAFATILRRIFGEPGLPLVVTASGVTRQWETFEEPVREVIDARIYMGIHFRTSDQTGARLGRQVARFVLGHALQPCRRGEGEGMSKGSCR